MKKLSVGGVLAAGVLRQEAMCLEMGYTVRRSRRTTAAIEITRAGEVLVRAPLAMPDGAIARFVDAHRTWIDRALQRQRARLLSHAEPTAEQVQELRALAGRVLPERVRYYALRMGVVPASVRITAARTRFGSCSAKNAICFSLYLMQYPPEAVDYVVVHELAHILHKNHGPAFYACIETVLPDYRTRRALLRQ